MMVINNNNDNDNNILRFTRCPEHHQKVITLRRTEKKNRLPIPFCLFVLAHPPPCLRYARQLGGYRRKPLIVVDFHTKYKMVSLPLDFCLMYFSFLINERIGKTILLKNSLTNHLFPLKTILAGRRTKR